MFFENWTSVANVVVAAGCVYVALVVVLRVTGKRTTSKMNSFDWVVTVALGSMAGTVILSKEVPIVDGIVGLAALVLLQYIVAKGVALSSRFQSLIKANPRLVYYRGEFRKDVMRKERITEAEIHAAARSQGHNTLEGVLAVVLETNADLSVITPTDTDDEELLGNVQGWSGE